MNGDSSHFPFAKSSEIPLSWRSSKNTPTLRQEAYNQSFDWALALADRIRKTRCYAPLEKCIGGQCADLFIEKSLFFLLWPVAMQYEREKAWNDLSGRPPGDITVSDPDIRVMLQDLNPDEGTRYFTPGGLPEKMKQFILSLGSWIHDTAVYHEAKNKRPADGPSDRIGLDMIEGVSDGQTRSELSWWDGKNPDARNIVCVLMQELPKEQKPLLDRFRANGILP